MSKQNKVGSRQIYQQGIFISFIFLAVFSISNARALTIEDRISPAYQPSGSNWCWAASIQFVIDYYGDGKGTVTYDLSDECIVNDYLEQCYLINLTGLNLGVDCCAYPEDGGCNQGLPFENWCNTPTALLSDFGVVTGNSSTYCKANINDFVSQFDNHIIKNQPALLFMVYNATSGHVVVGIGQDSNHEVAYAMDPDPNFGGFVSFNWIGSYVQSGIFTNGYNGSMNCAEDCPNGQTDCNGTCYDLKTNKEHCGSCTNACAGELTCINSTCACASGTQCGNNCYDLNTDKEHCGSCTNACAGELTCINSTCACASGTQCGNSCVDLGHDPLHCGACYYKCPAGHPLCGGNLEDFSGDCYFESANSISMCLRRSEYYIFDFYWPEGSKSLEFILGTATTVNISSPTLINENALVSAYYGVCN